MSTGNGRQLSCAALGTLREKVVVNGFPGSVPAEPGNLKFTIQGLNPPLFCLNINCFEFNSQCSPTRELPSGNREILPANRPRFPG
jgi:hypothetical protein